MSTSRKLSALEQKIHQAALASGEKNLTSQALATLAPDVNERKVALNFLLSAGLLKPLQHAGGKLSFRGVVKGELEMKKDLTAEENLVLSHIAAAGNEGIWTKHLKDKTELHQVVLDRCLKSLTQKQLVKVLKGSVQQRNRRIYMLYHLEPSAEMTGGPWYTDKELDTEFIKLLSQACLKFIADRSFPRSKSKDKDRDNSSDQRILYPISASPPYPTAVQVQTFLNKSKITETQLSVEHVEMLLNVLEIDGSIEKIPAIGAALWESTLGEDTDGDSSEDEERSSKSSKKRKRRDRDREDDSGKRRKKRKKADSSSEDDSESESEDERRAKSKAKKRRSKKKSRKDDSERDSDSGESSDEEEDRRKRRRKGKGKNTDDESDSHDSDDEDGTSKRARSKSKKKSSKRRRRDLSSSDDSESDSDSDESDDSSSRKSKSRSKSQAKSKSKSKSRRDVSPSKDWGFDDSDLLGSAHVYRAIHHERMLGYGFGLNQAPCGRCPTFEFCKDGGPVNAGECVYYGEWLNTAETKLV